MSKIEFAAFPKMSSTRLKYSAFTQLIMVRWCGVLGAEPRVLGGPMDFGCGTSHAQSTAATYFTDAVKSDVVHLIVVCWAFLLKSFGAEQIVHTRWPTEIFAHACVEVKPKSTPFMCISSRNKAYSCHVLRQSKSILLHAAQHGALVRRSGG